MYYAFKKAFDMSPQILEIPLKDHFETNCTANEYAGKVEGFHDEPMQQDH